MQLHGHLVALMFFILSEQIIKSTSFNLSSFLTSTPFITGPAQASTTPFPVSPTLQYEFASQANKWTSMPIALNVPSARTLHAAAVIQRPYPCSSLMVLFGGAFSNDNLHFQYLRDTWYHEFELRRWESMNSAETAPPARGGHSMVVLGSQIVLLFGANATNAFNDTWILPTTSLLPNCVHQSITLNTSWTQPSSTTCVGSPCPMPRWSHAAAAIGSSIYVFGGAISLWSSGFVTTQLQLADALTWRLSMTKEGGAIWEQVTLSTQSSPPVRAGAVCASWSNSSMVILGGYVPRNTKHRMKAKTFKGYRRWRGREIERESVIEGERKKERNI